MDSAQLVKVHCCKTLAKVVIGVELWQQFGPPGTPRCSKNPSWHVVALRTNENLYLGIFRSFCNMLKNLARFKQLSWVFLRLRLSAGTLVYGVEHAGPLSSIIHYILYDLFMIIDDYPITMHNYSLLFMVLHDYIHFDSPILRVPPRLTFPLITEAPGTLSTISGRTMAHQAKPCSRDGFLTWKTLS